MAEKDEEDGWLARMAVATLCDWFHRLGGAAQYDGMKYCEFCLYVAGRLLTRFNPDFNVEEFIDSRFVKAGGRAIGRADEDISKVKAKGPELLELVLDLIQETDTKLPPQHHSKKWREFIAAAYKMRGPVTREFAREAAAAYLANNPWEGIVGIDEVISAEETSQQLPRLYEPRPENLVEKSWIAYGKMKQVPGSYFLRSSYVILVAKDGGRILYAGSAHHEG